MTDTPAAPDAAANPTPAPVLDGASVTAAPIATETPSPSVNTTSGTSASTPVDGASETKTEAPKVEPSLLEAADGKKPEAKTEPKTEAKTETKESKADDKKSDAKDAPPPAEAKPEKEEAKAPDAAKEATADTPPAPVKYEAFKVPDGVKIDEAKLGKYTEILGGSQVSQEAAQKLVDLYAAELKEASDGAAKHQREVWTKLNDTWKAETRKEFGNHVETELRMAKAVIEEYGGSQEQARDLMAHLNNNGMGNYVNFIRMLANIGKKMNVFEDGIVAANPAAPKMPKGTPGSGKTGWYPSMGNGAAAS